MRDLYATEQMAGSPEEISNFISHLLQSNNPSSSSPKFSNSCLVGFSHPPLRTADAEASSSAGYRYEMPAPHRHEMLNYCDSRSFMWKEKMENEGLYKRVSSDNDDPEKGPDGPEMPADSVSHRSSSKRSRTAEIHNMSEKRRRTRINEKMKALQNLIPNSNKTDKASMLDEAIEYLKQLQLQVQMLTMRNGLSLHPMCVAEAAQPPVSFDEGDKISGGYALNEEKSELLAMNRSAQCGISNDAVLFPSSPLGFEPLYQVHYCGPYESTSAKEICREGSSRDRHQTDTVRAMKPSSSSRVS